MAGGLDKPLVVHQLAAGTVVVGWWRAGLLRRDDSWAVRYYGRLVLTSDALLFEPDRVYGDANSFFPLEVAFSLRLDTMREVAAYGEDRPPRLALTLVDGQVMVVVVVRRSGVVTQWTRDTVERDAAVAQLRSVLPPPTARAGNAPIQRVPHDLVVAGSERVKRRRRAVRFELVVIGLFLLVVVLAVMLALLAS